jgi:hypothetical protein
MLKIQQLLGQALHMPLNITAFITAPFNAAHNAMFEE